MEKVIKKYNINTIFFSSTYKEKILEIIKNILVEIFILDVVKVYVIVLL